jgi:hypothetical protein
LEKLRMARIARHPLRIPAKTNGAPYELSVVAQVKARCAPGSFRNGADFQPKAW